EGKSQAVIGRYHERMDAASQQLDFERAAAYRDQISQLRKIQAQQSVVGAKGDIDIVSVLMRGAGVVVLQMYIRGGRLLGSKSYFPELRLDQAPAEVLEAFLIQHYLDDQLAEQLPQELVLSQPLSDKSVLEEALETLKGSKVRISDRVRGQRREWLEIAERSAEQALGTHSAKRDHVETRFLALDDALEVASPLVRLECFDISHLQGEATVASCVVFDREGPRKSDYRRFNIEEVAAGDDYGAMKQALSRRYARLKKGEAPLPDVLFIDGGKGQLRQAIEVLDGLGIEGVRLIGVAKGPSRKAGLEKLIEVDGRELVLPPDHPGLHLIQHIRDESHRFAITGHQQRRQKARNQSPLEGIPGVGPTRRRQLLRHFGGLKQILDATPDDLAKVDGVSRRLAREIYATLHP
ncbi:MAG: excinuclease ABC subunit UvrC, partial [Pseudomonadales bacterium]